jgi:DNA-binding LacI/PurR family transcriptional regulator
VRPRATIKDVAKKADVSISTVSNYLNENYRNMSEETRVRVAEAVAELDYYPSIGAQSLPRKKGTNAICVVIPHNVDYTFHHPYFAEVMRGISSIIDDAGYRVLILTTKGKDRAETAYIRGLARSLIDGAVFFDVEPQDPYVHEFVGSRLPFMIVGRNEETNRYVDADIVDGLRIAGDHLLDLGHRRIALVSGPPNLVFSQQVSEGFLRAMQGRKESAAKELISYGPFSEADGYARAAEFMARVDRPTAVISASGKQTAGIIEYLRSHGLRMPRDLSIVSFGHHPVVSLNGVSLTYIDQPEVEIGRRVAHNLLSLIQDPLQEYEPTILPLTLVHGDSTRPPA